MRTAIVFCATLFASVGAVQAQVGDSPPDWHYGCDMAASKSDCLAMEQKALALLRSFWIRLPLSERERCVAQAESTIRSYVSIEVCTEPDIKNMSGGPDALKAYWQAIGVPPEFYQ